MKEQAVPQSIPAGLLATVPAPLPAFAGRVRVRYNSDRDLGDLRICSGSTRCSLDNETRLAVPIIDPTQIELLGKGNRRPHNDAEGDETVQEERARSPDPEPRECVEDMPCWEHSAPPVLRKTTAFPASQFAFLR